jgi:hypothetical protein
MVLQHLDSRTERHTTRIGNFAAANENHIENFMNEDNTAENDPPGTISSEQGMVSLLCSQSRLRGHTYNTLSRPLILPRAAVQA